MIPVVWWIVYGKSSNSRGCFLVGGVVKMVGLAASAKLGDENWLNSGTKTGQTRE